MCCGMMWLMLVFVDNFQIPSGTIPSETLYSITTSIYSQLMGFLHFLQSQNRFFVDLFWGLTVLSVLSVLFWGLADSLYCCLSYGDDLCALVSD